jgi:tetratricopeptide (TPR) repeat protein
MKSLLLALTVLLIPACGGANDAQGLVDEAQAALTAREYPKAAGLAAKAVAAAKQAGDESLAFRGTSIRISALAREGKGPEAVSALEAAATEYPSRVDAKLYARTMSALQQAKSIEGALDVLEAGSERFPDSRAAFEDGAAKLAAMLQSGAGSDPEAIERLKSLGYL